MFVSVKKIELIKFLITDKNLAGNIVYKILFLGKRPVLCGKYTNKRLLYNA